MDFVFIGDVGFDHEHRLPGFLTVILAEADVVEQLVGPVVEHHDVIGDVHVTVVIDPIGKRGFLVRFEGVHDRTRMDGLLDRYVMRAMDQIEELAEGETFYHDLLGMEVVTVEGEQVGEVIEVYELRPADLLEIRGPEKTFMIPYISEMIQSVSVADNRIVLDPPPGLLEV